MLTATFLFAGYSDYFQGYGCVDNDEHVECLLYASYGRHTTLCDIINQLVEDSWSGCGLLGRGVAKATIRKALLAMLSDTGREDYESGALVECATDLPSLTECPDCKTKLEDIDYDQCPECYAWLDQDESPIFVVVLDYEKGKS